MKPLAWSEFCPNDCDKKRQAMEVWNATPPNGPDIDFAPEDFQPGGKFFGPNMGGDDFKDEEITLDLGPPSSIDPSSYNSSQDDDWAGLDSLLDGLYGADLTIVTCPDCGSQNTEEFPNCLSGDWHCNPCGHVWYK